MFVRRERAAGRLGAGATGWWRRRYAFCDKLGNTTAEKNDLAEAHGWQVHFAGGGVPNDEIIGWIGQLEPQVLLVYGTIPSATPMVRRRHRIRSRRFLATFCISHCRAGTACPTSS